MLTEVEGAALVVVVDGEPASCMSVCVRVYVCVSKRAALVVLVDGEPASCMSVCVRVSVSKGAALVVVVDGEPASCVFDCVCVCVSDEDYRLCVPVDRQRPLL